jgi:sugar lactone lactonase YvrE
MKSTNISVRRLLRASPSGLLAIMSCLMVMAGPSQRAYAQIVITNNDGALPQTDGGTVGEYHLDGGVIDPALFSYARVYAPRGIAISGSNMFICNYAFGHGGSIGAYTTSGGVINRDLISGTTTDGAVAVSDGFIYASIGGGHISKFTTAGTLVPSFHIDVPDARFEDMAVSGDGTSLYVTNSLGSTLGYSVGKYDATTGAAISAKLITGLNFPTGIAVSSDRLYVVNTGFQPGQGSVAAYTLDGAAINTALITGLSSPRGIAQLDGELYVINNSTTLGSIGTYDAATGATINASFITGLRQPQDIAIVPEPAAWLLGSIGLAMVIAVVCRKRGAGEATR